MKKRVVKAYIGGVPAFIPQYKRSFINALVRFEFGWQYFYNDSIKNSNTAKVHLRSKENAISYCTKDPDTFDYETVWDCSEPKAD